MNSYINRFFTLSMLALGVGLVLAATPAQAQVIADDVKCDKCVSTSDIAKGAIVTSRLKGSTVTTSKLRDGAVATPKIRDGAVTTPKLAKGAVATSRIKTGAVTGKKSGPAR